MMKGSNQIGFAKRYFLNQIGSSTVKEQGSLPRLPANLVTFDDGMHTKDMIVFSFYYIRATSG